MFENRQVDIGDIPNYKSVSFLKLHKNYSKIVLLNSLITLAIGVAVCVVIYIKLTEFSKLYTILLLLLITLVLAIFPILSHKKKMYAFRQHDVLFRDGLIFKTTHISPFIRLQHVVIKQGWYAKKLGLATLVMYTAANNFSDISIPGLTLEDAEKWKSFLMNRIQELNDESENQP